jgi:hypothetical protein
MYTPCAHCGIILEAGGLHECLSNPAIITFETVGSGPVQVMKAVKAASWRPTADGYADLTLIMKDGLEFTCKVERRTGINVCRRLMGEPR